LQAFSAPTASCRPRASGSRDFSNNEGDTAGAKEPLDKLLAQSKSPDFR